MIYVTHDQTEAMTMGDKIVIMKDGIVNQIDSHVPILYSIRPKNEFLNHQFSLWSRVPSQDYILFVDYEL